MSDDKFPTEKIVLVIPAAGLGTRMKAISKGIPKEMLPLGNRPAIHHSLWQAFQAGIKRALIITNQQKEMIKRYFEDIDFAAQFYPQALPELEILQKEMVVDFAYQLEQKGEADAIACAAEFITQGDIIALTYPDNQIFSIESPYKILMKVFFETGSDVIGLAEVDETNSKIFGDSGHLDLEPIGKGLYRIVRFLPKGKGSFKLRYRKELRGTAFSVQRHDLFSYIDKARSRVFQGELIDLNFRKLILQERKLLAVKLPGIYFDIGNPDGYKACQEFLKKRGV